MILLLLGACSDQSSEFVSNRSAVGSNGGEVETDEAIISEADSESSANAIAVEPKSVAEEENALDEEDQDGEAQEVPKVPFGLKSNDIAEGQAIGKQFACVGKGGQNIAPQVSWGDGPDGTVKFALVMDDEDCGAGVNACEHWSVYNIDAKVKALEQKFGNAAAAGFATGKNYDNSDLYAGPCPPDTHTYRFSIYALKDGMPDIADGTQHTRASFKNAFGDFIIEESTLTAPFTP